MIEVWGDRVKGAHSPLDMVASKEYLGLPSPESESNHARRSRGGNQLRCLTQSA